MNSEANDLKTLMSVGVSVLQMLLQNFNEIFTHFSKNSKPIIMYKAIKDSAAKSTDELVKKCKTQKKVYVCFVGIQKRKSYRNVS